MSTFRRGAGAESLPDGLYEDVVTAALDRDLAALPTQGVRRAPLGAEDTTEALTSLISQAARLALESLGGKERVADSVQLTARVLQVLGDAAPSVFRRGEMVPTSEVLLSIARPNPLGLIPAPPTRPATPLSRSDLFTNSERHSVVEELASEMESADQIDLLCAFIKWSGFVKFRDRLTAHCRAGKPLRILTTTYLGATEPRAIAELKRLGAQVRVSYEETPTRLHAKAWMFHRATGLSTAYVGSSNLSRAALTEGLEWNVRVSAAELPRVVDKFRSVFTRYWDDRDAGFEPFDGTEVDLQRLTRAIDRAKASRGGTAPQLFTYSLDVHPHDYQRKMLEDLEVARGHGRTRNLVVAATGTGKTVVAALDYARLRASSAAETLLFVAHRETILRQARETFRAAVKDPQFGELWVEGQRPSAGRHVFASIQSLASAFDGGNPPTFDAFDHVVIDEVHHAPAETYAGLLRHLRPKVLVGLTATPERMDDATGEALRLDEFFDRPWASELRLWEAIDRQILVPFNYFAVDDGTDVREAWNRGRYVVSELSNLYSADHVWLKRVASAVRANVCDLGRMRALAFCVDVKHAELAAELLEIELGVRVEAVTSRMPSERRAALLHEFAGGAADRPRVLCVVDLLNEGVDVPPVDTLLLMRPTESATLFIQQLGRGLRRAPGKDALTVLDFIGVQHDNFRFDVRYTALLGTSRGDLQRAMKAGSFPRLPAGCSFQLEERPREQVLRALRRSLGLGLEGLAGRLDRTADQDLTLQAWLEREQLELPIVFDDGRTWGDVRKSANFEVPGVSSDEEKAALHNLQKMIHVDDAWRLRRVSSFIAGHAAPASESDRRLVQMLGSILFGFETGSDAVRVLKSFPKMPRLRWELEQLVQTLGSASRVIPRPLSSHLPPEVPLHLHARYLTQEIAAAFDLRSRKGLLYSPQAGVINTGDYDLLLVTLDKKAKSAMPHLQYEDYAISPTLFHWESQATTRRDDSKGRRHLGDQVRPLLFVREFAKDERGLGAPYRFLGAVKRQSDEGERPIRIVWELLDAPLPADLLERSRAAVA